MTDTLTTIDRLRIWWLSARYDLWLDLRSVRRKDRRELSNELVANVRDAAADFGVTEALIHVGGPRQLARQVTETGELRSAWTAAIAVGLTTFTGLGLVFFLLSLYYIEGVLDTGTTEVVSGGLFPFFGSEVEVAPDSGSGLGFSVSPGLLPFAAAFVAAFATARPWRSLHRSRLHRPANAD